MKQWEKQTGFTIVELLIVVVVIAILAAITIVAYNGVTERSRFSSMRSELSSINRAILMYHAENGAYPITPGTSATCNGSWCGWGRTTGDDFIPGLSPKYIAKIPQMPLPAVSGETYLYRSPDGVNYKLIRLVQSGVSASESAAFADLMTTDCGASINTTRWGYWNSATSKCW